jgi:PPM family protein phosphatase
VRTGSATHVGHMRERNEDAFLVAVDRGVFLVLDGLGGHVAGDRASRIAVEQIDEVLTAERLGVGTKPTEALDESLQAADEAILDETVAEPSLQGMATTAVLAHVREDEQRAWIAHVGDSRAYLLRRGALHRLTEDHTTGGALGRGSITQALGAGPIEPDIGYVDLEAGDRLLLCTDGLTDMVDEGTIEQVLAGGDGPQESCDALVEEALGRGGMDNITVVLVDVDGTGS